MRSALLAQRARDGDPEPGRVVTGENPVEDEKLTFNEREVNSAFLARAGEVARAHPLLSAMSAGFLLRLAAMPLCYHNLLDPTRDYWRFGWETGRVAMAIASGHGYSSPLPVSTGPTAWLPPLYPFLLAEVFRIFGIFSKASALVILTLNGIFSTLTCIPVYFAALTSFGRRSAAVAAWGWALFPYAIYYSNGRVWENCLTALLFSILFLIALRLRPESSSVGWLGWGALWGVTMLANPAVLGTLPFLLGWMFVRFRDERGGMPARVFDLNYTCSRYASGKLLARFAAMIAAALLVATPWTLRNYRVFHRLMPLRDNFWMEMYFGNTGDLSEIIPGWAHPSTSAQELGRYRQLGELNYNREKKEMFFEFVRRHPLEYAGLCLRRFANMWTGYWSFNREFLRAEPYTFPNMFFVILTSFITFAGLWLAFRRQDGSAVPYALVMLSFPFIYYLSHAELEYRHPIEPLMVVLAAYGIVEMRRASEVEEAEECAELAEIVVGD